MSWSLLEHVLLTSRMKYCTEFEALHSFCVVDVAIYKTASNERK